MGIPPAPRIMGLAQRIKLGQPRNPGEQHE
jgi:hypothetical protein